MTIQDTARINDLDESTQVYVRQLQQQINDLSQLLNNQQDLLRKYGMTLSTASQDSWQTLGKAIETFANNRQEARQELKYLNALADTLAVINSSLDLNDVLVHVMDTVIQLNGAERGFIMLRNDQTNELEFRVARGIDREQLDAAQFTVSQTIINQVATTGEPTITDNATLDPRYQSNQSVVGFQLRSIMAVPLKLHDDVIGVVYCDNRIFTGIFKPQDLHLLTGFANQAAIAIHNASLYEDARNHLNEMRGTSDLLTNILESIVSGVVTVDINGDVTTCNLAAAEMMGKASYEVEGQALSAALPEDIADVFTETITKVQQTGEQMALQLEPMLNSNNQRYWTLVISPLRNDYGTLQGVVVVLDDLTEIRQHTEQLNQARRYLPAALVNNLRDIDVAGLVGEERFITAVSTDVRGFTTFSERLEPEELMEIINKYLSLASDAISFYKGVVDKFMGDAVTGLFNTQLNPQEDHAVRAVRALLGLMSDLHALHEMLPEEQRLYYGAGIHTGLAVLGNVGSADRKEFAAIGEATELSKVLEANARPGEVIISEATYRLVKEYFACEAFTPEKTKGHDLPIAYRVLRQTKPTGPVSLDDFDF